jgi:hypothetical protein
MRLERPKAGGQSRLANGSESVENDRAVASMEAVTEAVEDHRHAPGEEARALAGAAAPSPVLNDSAQCLEDVLPGQLVAVAKNGHESLKDTALVPHSVLLRRRGGGCRQYRAITAEEKGRICVAASSGHATKLRRSEKKQRGVGESFRWYGTLCFVMDESRTPSIHWRSAANDFDSILRTVEKNGKDCCQLELRLYHKKMNAQ